MEQSINSFLDNENLTIHNSLTHLLDFDDDYSDLTNSIKPSMYYSEEDFMSELNPKSCTIMSLNCQSLHAKFTQIKILLDTFAANDTPIQVLQYRSASLSINPASRAGACTDCEYIECTIAIIIIVILVRSLFLVDKDKIR